MRIDAVPDPGQTLKSKEVEFLREKYTFSRKEIGQKTYLLRYKSHFEWQVTMILDPDPHSQYGSGSRTAKSMRIHADPDPQHCLKAT